MRPRKKVLLLATNEVEMDYWRYRMDIWLYEVLATTDLFDALELAEANPDCFMAATTVEGRAGADALLIVQNGIDRVLLFGMKEAPTTLSQHVELAGQELEFRVRKSLKELSALKRGPKCLKPYSIYRRLTCSPPNPLAPQESQK